MKLSGSGRLILSISSPPPRASPSASQHSRSRMVGRRNSDISAKGKEIILHPKLARVVNEKHEKAKRETPRIPMEVLQTVVVKFVDDVKTVASIAMASKSLNEIVEDDVLWSRLYALKFPMPSTPPPKGKWKELYVFQAKVSPLLSFHDAV